MAHPNPGSSLVISRRAGAIAHPALIDRAPLRDADRKLDAKRQTANGERPAKGVVHKLSLAIVWLAVASSAIVASEPAPTDLLTMGLAILLPLVGLVSAKRGLVLYAAFWLVISAALVIATTQSQDLSVAYPYAGVSLYLAGAAVLFAAFIAKAPAAHARLIFSGYTAAAVFASGIAIAGYFDVVPGLAELTTRYGRAMGPFKDPNVFAPFLIPAMVMALSHWLSRPLRKGFGPLAVLAICGAALLLSFSRGAWAAAIAALAIYSGLYLVTAKRNLERAKLVALVISGSIAIGGLVITLTQFDSVNKLLNERATLTQSYDEGPEGRFGGQGKALELAIEHPLGLGPQQFTTFHHHEETHNVYLNMLVNTGWLGGFLYLALVSITVMMGLRHAFRRTETQAQFHVVLASLIAIAALGAVIDTDHWRHFYLLMGMTWGLMAGDPAILRSPKIVMDRRPMLMQRAVVLPATRRAVRIVRELPRKIEVWPANQNDRDRYVPTRPARILGPAG